MKKRLSMVMSIIVAVSVVCGMFSPLSMIGFSVRATDSNNLIKNGEFNNGTEDWTIAESVANGEPAKVVEHGGRDKVLKMATVKADGADSTVKQTIAVKERTNYSLSYYVYSEGENWYDNGTGNKASQMKYSVMTTGDSPATIGTGTFEATGSNKYKFTLVTLTFNSGDNTYLDIVFDLANNGPYNSISGSGFSFFCIDDVSVTETVNLILNGSFDEGTFVKQEWGTSVGSFGPWKIHWDVAQDTAAGHADVGEIDTNSITIREYGESLNNAMNYISQKFYVKQNTSYKLTFWAKSSTADVPYKAIISNQGETSATNSAIPSARITYKTRANAAADTWEQFELEFNSGDNTVLYLYITGAYKDDSLRAKTNIDDVSIVEYTAEDGENSNLISDGDFENITRTNSTATGADIGAWKTGFGWGADVNKDEHHSGSQSLKLLYENSKSNAFYVYQQIKVKKNTGYNLTFWYKSTETLACEVVTKHGFTYPYAESDSILAHQVVGTLNDSDPEWKEVTLNFNSGDNETLYVQFDANALDHGVSDTNYAYIDDVSVELMGKPENLILNGEFNSGTKGWTIAESVANGEPAKVVEHGGRDKVLKMATYKNANYDSSAVKQTINVEPNTDYNLKYVVYTDGDNWVSGKPSKMTTKVVGDGETLLTNDLQATGATTGTWTEISLIFNSGDNNTVDIVFDLLNTGAYNNANGTGFTCFYIDSVSAESMAADAGENLIENGGFEYTINYSDSRDWESLLAEDKDVITTGAKEGNKALRLAGRRSHAHDPYIYQKIKVEKNTNYKLTFYVRGGVELAYQIVNAHGFYYTNADGTSCGDNDNETVQNSVKLLDRRVTPSSTESWQIVSAIFNSGDFEELYLQFDPQQSMWVSSEKIEVSKRIQLDDVSIVKIKTDSVISNGDFENETDFWYTTDDAITADSTAYAGSYALKLNTGEGFACQPIFVDTTSNYKVSFWYKGDITTPKSPVVLTTDCGSLNGADIVYRQKLDSKSDWTKVEFVISAKDANILSDTLGYLWLEFLSLPNGDCYYVDDVTVEKTDEAENIVENGSDSGFGGFSNGNGSVFTDNNAGPFIADSEDNLITDSGFEGGSVSSGNWNKTSFLSKDGDYGIYLADADFKDGAAVNSGSYGIVFKAGEKKVSGTFYAVVQPNTTYYFTTFVKMPTYDSKTNKGTMSFGITNTETGNFISYSGTASYYPFSDTYQAAPFSPDNEWHLMSLKFNSGSSTDIGITIQGTVSEVYFDDMYLVSDADKIRYVEENSLNRLNWEYASFIRETDLIACESDKNLVTNSDCESGDSFWNDSEYSSSYGKFLKVGYTGSDSYGNALVYENDELNPDRTYYIRWVEVKKNTMYTFSADYLLEEYGDDTFFGIVSADQTRLRVPKIIKQVYLNESAYNEDPSWKSIGVQFDTNADTDLIGIVFSNCGGKAYIDNISLFETFDENGNNNGVTRALVVKDWKLESTVCDITSTENGNIIFDLSNGVKLSNFVATFKHNDKIKVFDKNNQIITDWNETMAGTGVRIKLMDGPAVVQSAKICIYGDVDGNSYIDSVDIKQIRKGAIGLLEFDDVFFTAADLDKDMEITIHDAVLAAKKR